MMQWKTYKLYVTETDSMITLFHGSNVVINEIDLLSKNLVQMLMDEYSWDMKTALDELYRSETYRKLTDSNTGLYYESPVYVFSFLKNEIETGASR